MSSGTGGITKPDSVILDAGNVFLGQFDTVEDFSGGFFHFAELVHVVPEFGASDDRVGCEDDHAVGFWVWVFFGAGFAADYLVLIHCSCHSHLWGWLDGVRW